MNAGRVNAIGIVVSDMARSLRFYQALGCPLPEAVGPDEKHVEADLGAVRLMLDTENMMRSFDPRWSAPGAGRVNLAAECDSPTNVDQLHAELSALGAGSHLAPFDAPWGQRYATVLDPDGTKIDLYAASGQPAGPSGVSDDEAGA